jgi:hypothetical protein
LVGHFDGSQEEYDFLRDEVSETGQNVSTGFILSDFRYVYEGKLFKKNKVIYLKSVLV